MQLLTLVFDITVEPFGAERETPLETPTERNAPPTIVPSLLAHPRKQPT